MKKKKVVFYFPWKEVSGGPVYLSNIASQLADFDEYEVYYTDYKNGLSDTLLTNKKVKKIEYQEHGFSFPIQDPVVLITPIYWAHVVPNIHPESKIVFLNWHYCCIPVLKGDSGWDDKTIHRFLSLVHQTDSYFFCDLSHRLGQNTKDLLFKPMYVPITLNPKPVSNVNFDLINKDEINIGILGRLCPDKIWSCLDLLGNVRNYAPSKKINVHLIGDGSHADLFKKEYQQLNLPDNIHLIMYGRLVGDALNETLSKHMDVLFAMGTSILEGAALKIPSVIMPHNTHAFHKDAYVYLQDTKEFCLGWLDTQMDELGIKGVSLKEILDDLYLRHRKEELAQKAYTYYCNNHTSNVQSFIDVMSATTLQKKQLANLRITKQHKLKWVRKIFSITNIGRHKVLTLLGLKICLRRLPDPEEEKTLKMPRNWRAISTAINQLQEHNRQLERKLDLMHEGLCYWEDLYHKVRGLHGQVFPKYKNAHEGQTAVLLASGPTVNQFNPKLIEADAKYVAVNGSFAYDKVNFDYLFLQHYSVVKESIAKIPFAENLKHAKKFYGIMSPVPNEMIVPESVCRRDGAERYYAHSVCFDTNLGTRVRGVNYAYDLATEPFLCHGTISLIAMQFLLYANFKKIYLVGCDCSAKGHFSTKMEKQDTTSDVLPILVLGWQRLRAFSDTYYPDTEIISVNPVGLTGLFKDIKM